MYIYGEGNKECRIAVLQAMYLRGIWDFNTLTQLANEYAFERRVLDDGGRVVYFADKVIYLYVMNSGHSGRGTAFTNRKLLVLGKVLGVDDPMTLDEKFTREFDNSLPCRWVGDCGSILTISPIKRIQDDPLA